MSKKYAIQIIDLSRKPQTVNWKMGQIVMVDELQMRAFTNSGYATLYTEPDQDPDQGSDPDPDQEILGEDGEPEESDGESLELLGLNGPDHNRGQQDE